MAGRIGRPYFATERHVPFRHNYQHPHGRRARLEHSKLVEIVAYCRGPYCLLSFEAVASLRAKGYRVRRLEDGFPEWKAAGLEIEAAA